MKLQALKYPAACAALLALAQCSPTEAEAPAPPAQAKEKEYAPLPAVVPATKPDRPMSSATHRLYDQWAPTGHDDNPFATTFKYSKVIGLGPEDGISRRDPSTIIKKDGIYYVWFTRRDSPTPAGVGKQTATIPSVDWDLADIGYATSKDGYTWEDQGIAVPRATGENEVGNRTLSTPDVLQWEGKYYLYYQTAQQPGIPPRDLMEVSMAVADHPTGPWKRINEIVVPRGATEDWDGGSIHDPFPIVFNGKIHLYYKAKPQFYDVDTHEPLTHDGKTFWIMQGVAIADHPEGPFVKPPENPVLNSGHETLFYRFKNGVASVVTRDGPEANTIQFSEDGINFEVKTTTHLPPLAGGPFDPDAFSNTDNAEGITWGLSHMIARDPVTNEAISYVVRWDCDLRQGERDPRFLHKTYSYAPEVFFSSRWTVLPDAIKNERLKNIATRDKETAQ